MWYVYIVQQRRKHPSRFRNVKNIVTFYFVMLKRVSLTLFQPRFHAFLFLLASSFFIQLFTWPILNPTSDGNVEQWFSSKKDLINSALMLLWLYYCSKRKSIRNAYGVECVTVYDKVIHEKKLNRNRWSFSCTIGSNSESSKMSDKDNTHPCHCTSS